VKTIIDSSVLISAFLTPGRATSSLVRAGIEGRFEMYVSDQIPAQAVSHAAGNHNKILYV
jgi:predicted nucleic acid-binding protein